MRKQYVFKTIQKNGNIRYLVKVDSGYPFKSENIEDAMIFTTKANAWNEYRKISKSNIGYETWELIIK